MRDKRARKLTVGEDGAAVGRALGKNDSRRDILEHGHKEHGRVLEAREVLVLLVGAVLVRLEPHLALDVHEGEDLHGADDEHVAEEAADGPRRDQLVLRGLFVELGKGLGAREEEGHHGGEAQIDVQKLDVRDSRVDGVEDKN